MKATDLIDRLTKHRTLGEAPREELEWLASHGSLRQMDSGDVLTPKDKRVEGLFVVLSGRVTISVDRGSGLQKIMEWREGDVTGLLPYSRMVTPPGDSVVEEPTEILEVPRDLVAAMPRECHQITAILVHKMLDRARTFNSSALHDEKMVSLGKLSAGLAHELNNPASAIERSAALLADRLCDSERAARSLNSSTLTDSQLAVIEGVRESCMGKSGRGVRSPIEEVEREESLADWLSDHGLETDMAEGLADTAVTFEQLERLASAVDGPELSAVLRWAAAECSVRDLASEIQDAAMRISGLVTAVKGFTHLDQARIAEPVDLVQGLSNTVAVLKSKARAKSVAVSIDLEHGLPFVLGFAAELNQIWANLIDNALDAVPDSGRVEVKANHKSGHVVVHVADNGSGIPQEIRDRIFDPFFTTKPVGQGTGLGLDIVHRLVRHNGGHITVDSQPGWTEFRVVLPVAEANGEEGVS